MEIFTFPPSDEGVVTPRVPGATQLIYQYADQRRDYRTPVAVKPAEYPVSNPMFEFHTAEQEVPPVVHRNIGAVALNPFEVR